MCFLIETVPVRMMCIPMVVAEAWHIVVTPLGGGNTRGPRYKGGGGLHRGGRGFTSASAWLHKGGGGASRGQS